MPPSRGHPLNVAKPNPILAWIRISSGKRGSACARARHILSSGVRFYTDVLRLAVQHDADLERLRKAPGAGDFQGTKQDELTDARDNATAGIACL